MGQRVRTVAIVNPAAGGAEASSALGRAARRAGWQVWRTADAGDAERMAARAVEQGAGRVVACGGDGTVNEVVQGLLRHPAPARLAVVPLGTANDLARTLDLPADPEAAVELVERGEERTIDVLRVESAGRVRHCVNVAAGGFSGEVDRAVESAELKEVWGPLAYVAGAVEVARELQPYEVVLQVDDEPPEPVPALAVTVANGRTCGGGLRVAPWADPEDGLLDVTVIRHGSVLELGGLAARLLSGTILDSPHVLRRQGQRVHVRSAPPMWFNVDGELYTEEPATFAVVPKALRVTVGPAYRRDPALDALL